MLPIRRATRLAALASLVAIGAVGAAGCGGSGVASNSAAAGTPISVPSGVTAPRQSTVLPRGPSGPTGVRAREPRSIPVSASQAALARVDASSDATLAANPGLIAPGAPSDAQVRRELEQAQKAGIVLPGGNTAASFANSPSGSGFAAAAAVPAGAEIPEAPWNPLRKPIADWIVPVLQWAHQYGWTGTVTSGYRSYAEQAAINAAGAFSAPAGRSNHEFTAYPGGAVDVTNPAQLLAVLPAYPGPEKLVGGVLGPVDPEHFSATGD